MNEAPSSIRLNKKVREKLAEATMEVNKKLLMKNSMAYTPTQLMHVILEIAFEKANVDKNGKIVIK